MKLFLVNSLVLWASLALFSQNHPPLISNLQATPDWGNLTLTITYEVSDAENDPLEISLQFSDNAGKNYALSSQVPATGDLGFPVQPGSRTIQCDISALANIPVVFQVRLIADDKQSFDLQSLVNEVDSNRLRADLEFVEGIRHRTTGLAHLLDVRDSIKNHFENRGLHYQEQAFNFGNFTALNLIGTLPGSTAPEKVVINDAHYDTVSNAPGADDNGSGTVGVMEAARILSRYPCKKTLRFIGFDLEESGLLGSIRYVTSGIPAGEQIEGVFNLEMIGYWSDQPNTQVLPQGFPFLFPDASAQVAANEYRGDFITNVGNTNSQPISLLFSSSAQQYVPDLKVITLEVPGNGEIAPDLRRSDHTPFWEAGYQALMLSDGANFRNECYHTPGDTLDDKLSFTFMANVVKATIASMAQLAEIQHGDWETATFQGKVGTIAPLPCKLNAYQLPGQQGEFLIDVNACTLTDAVLELFDMKGQLLLQKNMVFHDFGKFSVPTPLLPAGTYVLKISHRNGTQAQKIFLR